MKTLYYIPALLAAFTLIMILLVTSVEAVVYWTPGYFEKEYEKHQVLDDVHMEMDELLAVTEHMMDYLRGEEEELQTTAVVGGVERNFFSGRELAHMVDVKNLFLGALSLRRISIIIFAASAALLGARKCMKILFRGILLGTGAFLGIICLVFAVVSTDFTKYFTLFHRIFFDNNLWILDPDTDLLINIVPEPFFIDTAVRIGILFGISLTAVLAACVFLVRKQKAQDRRCPAEKVS